MSGDASRGDRRADNALDCWTAHDMSYAVHNVSHYVRSSWSIKISLLCVLVGKVSPFLLLGLLVSGGEIKSQFLSLQTR